MIVCQCLACHEHSKYDLLLYLLMYSSLSINYVFYVPSPVLRFLYRCGLMQSSQTQKVRYHCSQMRELDPRVSQELSQTNTTSITLWCICLFHLFKNGKMFFNIDPKQIFLALFRYRDFELNVEKKDKIAWLYSSLLVILQSKSLGKG